MNFQTGVEISQRLEAEIGFGAGGIQATSWLAVGFGWVPADLAGEARQLYDLFNQILDRDLKAGTDIDRLVAIVFFCRQYDRFITMRTLRRSSVASISSSDGSPSLLLVALERSPRR